jgi:hypothetical protein
VYDFFQGIKGIAPAVVQKMIEYDFMETFHLSPKQIEEIPMKKIQEIMLIKRVKSESMEIRAKLDQVRAQAGSAGSAGGKGYREV